MITGKRAKDIALLAIMAMLVQIALTKWVYPIFKTTTQTIFSITPATAIGSQTYGNKILGYLSGIIPLNFGSFGPWISMFIGVFLLLLVGYWIYEQRWAWKGRNESQRLWAILGYGSIVLAAILYITNWGSIAKIGLNLLLGVAINYALIALIVSGLATKVKFFRFLRI